MDSVRERAVAWLACPRGPAAVIEVVQALGSVPREVGTRMLVTLDATHGTIGGGHLELQAIAEARALLRDPASGPRSRHYPLGPALGQCCGGAVTLQFDPLDAATLARWPERPPRFHLQLYGAGHVGRAIARALVPLEVTVDWIDERESEFAAAAADSEGEPLPWPPHIRRVCVDSVESEVAAAPAGAFYLVLTHCHDLDLRITQAILQRGDFGFLGLIGSETKRARFMRRFRDRGLRDAVIARMTCPIGLPGIDGKAPAVIAASVVAQLLTVSGDRASQPDGERRAVSAA